MIFQPSIECEQAPRHVSILCDIVAARDQMLAQTVLSIESSIVTSPCSGAVRNSLWPLWCSM